MADHWISAISRCVEFLRAGFGRGEVAERRRVSWWSVVVEVSEVPSYFGADLGGSFFLEPVSGTVERDGAVGSGGHLGP